MSFLTYSYIFKYFILIYIDFQNIFIYNRRIDKVAQKYEVNKMKVNYYKREEFNRILNGKIAKKLITTATILAGLGILNKF